MRTPAPAIAAAPFLAWSFSDMPLYPHLYAIPIVFTLGVAVGWFLRHVFREKS
jgi:hypothetical protein